MRPQKLNEAQKDLIAHLYTTKQKNQGQLAEMYRVSARTIRRALTELNVPPNWYRPDMAIRMVKEREPEPRSSKLVCKPRVPTVPALNVKPESLET